MHKLIHVHNFMHILYITQEEVTNEMDIVVMWVKSPDLLLDSEHSCMIVFTSS